MNQQAAKYIQALQELGPVAWAEGPNGWTGEDGQPITLADWQRAALNAWWEHRADTSTFGVSNVKKTGKTFTNAVILCWRWLALPGQHFAAGNDLDQAQSRQFDMISEMVKRSPFLSENVKIGKSELVFTLTGSKLTALAADAAGNAGANFLTASHTEAWGILYESGIRAWEELTSPPGRFYGLPALRIVDSYAGFLGESKTWHNLVDRGLAGKRIECEWPVFKTGGLLLFHMDGSAAQEACFRGTEAEREDYYAEQAESLRPNAFTRMHGNQRTSGESAFVTEEQWQSCYSPDVNRLVPGERVRLALGADASQSHDYTALVGLDGGDVRLVKVWKPKKIAGIRFGGAKVDLEATIGQEVLNLHESGNVSAIVYDPWQLAVLAKKWQDAGIRCVEMPQTLQRTQADTALADAIVSGQIHTYRSEELTEAVRNAVIIEGPRGIRIAKERSSKRIDALVAMSMAYSVSVNEQYSGVVTCQPNPFYGAYADDENKDFVQLSDGGYIIIPKENAERTHPLTLEAVEKCHWSAKGCPACIKFFEESGFYLRQKQEAEITAHAGIPDYQLMEKLTMPVVYPEVEQGRRAVNIFWKRVRKMRGVNRNERTV